MTTTQMSFLTALGPNDPDDGQAGRQQRGMAIAAVVPIHKNPLGYQVPSQSGNGSYTVAVGDEPFCTCPDFEKRQEPCKHVYAVEYTIQREERPDGTVVETKTVRTTYRQEWASYNAAQVHEQELFGQLLRDLCDAIPQPPQGKGRPRLPLSDMVFAVGTKVYSTMSGRRAMTDVRNAQATGQLDKTPSFNSVLGYLKKPEMTPLLKALIEQSAAPLRAVESDFAADASGFSTSVYDRWFDHKWGKEKKQARFIKAHIMCGVKTNIVTAAEVTEANIHDSPMFKGLVERTALNFDMSEISADKAYLSRGNLKAIVDAGATPFIPFKSNSLPEPRNGQNPDPIWQKAYHFFQLHREAFLDFYHKRSNVETTFHMIKAKFGGAVRSKTPEAQINEVLVKILCHNIVVLIQSMFELNIIPALAGSNGLFVQNGQLHKKSA
ncbi:MAG: transposase [Chloroflexota bacterium]|nr:transposase [Chloroflexota bacterium]